MTAHRFRAALLGTILATLISAASGNAAADPLGEINALRTERGLGALAEMTDADIATRVIQTHEVGGLSDGGGLGFGSNIDDDMPPCAVCSGDARLLGGTASSDTIIGLWREAAGVSTAFPVTIPTGASVRDTLNAYPRAAAVLLSSEATVAMVARGKDVDVVILNTSSLPAEGALRAWPEGEIDPARPYVVWGGTGGSLTIRPVGGRLAGPGGSADSIADGAGLWTIRMLPIGYGGSYRLESGGVGLDLRVAPRTPGAPVFAPSMRPKDRALFLRSFRGSPKLNREILALIGDRLSIQKRPTGCGEGNSCVAGGASGYAAMTLHRWHIGSDLQSRFVMQHEFGHAVMFTGLAEGGMAAFETLLKRTKRYRCTPYSPFGGAGPKGCVPLAERFADEYARWALGTRRSLGGYRTPALLTRAQMGRFLATWWTLAPPLPRDAVPGGRPAAS